MNFTFKSITVSLQEKTEGCLIKVSKNKDENFFYVVKPGNLFILSKNKWELIDVSFVKEYKDYIEKATSALSIAITRFPVGKSYLKLSAKQQKNIAKSVFDVINPKKNFKDFLYEIAKKRANWKKENPYPDCKEEIDRCIKLDRERLERVEDTIEESETAETILEDTIEEKTIEEESEELEKTIEEDILEETEEEKTIEEKPYYDENGATIVYEENEKSYYDENGDTIYYDEEKSYDEMEDGPTQIIEDEYSLSLEAY